MSTPVDDAVRAARTAAVAQQAGSVQAPSHSPPPGRAAAFFDVDNTVMVGASMYHFARGLAARKFFTTRDLASFAIKQVRFRVGGESHDDMVSTRESALAFVAGKPVEEVVALSEEIYDETMADKIWAGTRALAQQHLDAGEPVWLVTATPVELARIIAERLHLTGALGTVAETRDGAYTGRLVGNVLHGQAKADAVRALAVREGLELTRCSAYSDSVNDVPMLAAVGRAVAVNPDPALRAEARRRGWEVRDFRGGRRAARIGLPAAALLAAVAAAAAGGLAWRRAVARARHRRARWRPAALAGIPFATERIWSRARQAADG